MPLYFKGLAADKHSYFLTDLFIAGSNTVDTVTESFQGSGMLTDSVKLPEISTAPITAQTHTSLGGESTGQENKKAEEGRSSAKNTAHVLQSEDEVEQNQTQVCSVLCGKVRGSVLYWRCWW